MLRLAIVVGGLVVTASGAAGYPLKQVSRSSTCSNVGWYDYHAFGQTPSHTDWNVSDSTAGFGYWEANMSGAVYFGADQTSDAGPYLAKVNAVAFGDSFLGNQASWHYTCSTTFSYIFDVMVPLTVTLKGSGMKLTGPSGFAFTVTSNTPVVKSLAPGRYTFATTSAGGATAQLDVNSCAMDLTGDDVVDDADFVVFGHAYDLNDCGEPGMGWTCLADFNSDHAVDDADFVLFLNGYIALLCP